MFFFSHFPAGKSFNEHTTTDRHTHSPCDDKSTHIHSSNLCHNPHYFGFVV